MVPVLSYRRRRERTGRRWSMHPLNRTRDRWEQVPVRQIMAKTRVYFRMSANHFEKVVYCIHLPIITFVCWMFKTDMPFTQIFRNTQYNKHIMASTRLQNRAGFGTSNVLIWHQNCCFYTNNIFSYVGWQEYIVLQCNDKEECTRRTAGKHPVHWSRGTCWHSSCFSVEGRNKQRAQLHISKSKKMYWSDGVISTTKKDVWWTCWKNSNLTLLSKEEDEVVRGTRWSSCAVQRNKSGLFQSRLVFRRGFWRQM